jgi:phenylalanyl-tRNA synthetase beta chain
MAALAEPEERIPPARLRTLLADRDYHEIITYSFVDPELQALLDPEVKPATLANPISADMAAMRTSLWPGLLQTIIYNLNRQQERLRFFEIGKRFLPGTDGIREEAVLAGAMSGEALPKQWGQSRRTADFFDAKGDVEALLRLTGRGQDFRFRAVRHPALHPGRAAEIVSDGRRMGLMGELHPELHDRLSLDRPVVLYELRLDAVTTANAPVFQGISRYPAIRRDLAIIVPETTPAQTVLDCIVKVAGNLLVHLELFDEYRGKGIDYGRKSLALGLTLQDSSRTLKDTEVEAVMAKVVSALESELGAQRRR